MEDENVLDDFEADFPKADDTTDPFAETTEAPKKDETDPEEVPEDRKNRRHRRLEEKLNAEREANIALTERVKVLSEVDKFKRESGESGIDLSKIYGSETPEAREATRILQEAFKKTAQEAEQNALARFEAKQAEALKAQKEAEGFITQELEALEDEFNVDLTSNAPAARKARSQVLALVEKMSPKDSDGNIKDYGDFSTAFEVYQERTKRDSSRQKGVAARSMVRSGGSQQTVTSKPEEDYLRSIGII